MDSLKGSKLLYGGMIWAFWIFVMSLINDAMTADTTGSSVIVIGVNDTTAGDNNLGWWYVYMYPGEIAGITIACLVVFFLMIICICVGIRRSSRRQQMLAQQTTNNSAMYSTSPTAVVVRTTRSPQYNVASQQVISYSQVNPGYYPGPTYSTEPVMPTYSPPNSYGNQGYPPNSPPSYEAQSQAQQGGSYPNNTGQQAPNYMQQDQLAYKPY